MPLQNVEVVTVVEKVAIQLEGAYRASGTSWASRGYPTGCELHLDLLAGMYAAGSRQLSEQVDFQELVV